MFYSFTLHSELEFLQARMFLSSFCLAILSPLAPRKETRAAIPRNGGHTHAAIHALLAMTLAQIVIYTCVTFWSKFAHLLSFLNSHPSPNFRNSRAMPTDPLTITNSAKAAKRIKAIVSMFLSFKIFVERRESNPSKTRLPHSLSTDALTGWGGDRTRLTTKAVN